ncbi:MAG: acyl-CoA dehydrogenase family protein [Pseudomonadota bacterium]
MPDRTFLDWPFLEPRHRLIVDQVEVWAERNAERIIDDAASTDDACRDLVASMAEAGLTRYAVAGIGPTASDRLDVRTLCLIRETLSRHYGLADFAFAMQGLGSGPLCLFGTERQRQRFLPQVVGGTSLAAFALSEPEAGSDVAALACSARRDGDAYVLNGRKTWISNGGIAGHYIVFARTGEAPGAKGLSAFVVPAKAAGLDIEARIEVVAPHPLATLRFADCRIPVDNLIGEPGQGFKIAMATLDVFRATVGAAALGLARRALDEALDYSDARVISGTALSDMQMTQSALADMAVAIDTSALLVYRAAWAKDQGADRVTREASMAKLHATETAQMVIDRAVQLHGGLGVMIGSKVEELYREVRALRIYEGASEVQKLVISRSVLDARRSARNLANQSTADRQAAGGAS